MCDACVIEPATAQAPSRRALFRGAGAVGLAGPAAGAV